MVNKVVEECQNNPELIIEGLAPELAKKGKWPEKIDKALFSMEAGEVSDIIEDDAHYMVIKIVYVRPDTLLELKVVSDNIRKNLEQEKFIQLRQEMLQAASKKYKIELYEEFK
jgi:parvulin-like peptidyl-prolyl isomerase